MSIVVMEVSDASVPDTKNNLAELNILKTVSSTQKPNEDAVELTASKDVEQKLKTNVVARYPFTKTPRQKNNTKSTLKSIKSNHINPLTFERNKREIFADFDNAICELRTELRNEVKSGLNRQQNTQSSKLFIGIWDTVRMSDMRLKLLKRSILENIMKESSKVSPCFNGCTFQSGWLQVICKDMKTVEWLHRTIPSLRPWQNANLKVKCCADLPRKNIIILHAMNSEANTPQEAIKLLKVQNSLEVDKWEMFKVVNEHDIMKVYFYISDACVEDLHKMNYRPSFGFQKALVEVLQEKRYSVGKQTNSEILKDTISFGDNSSVVYEIIV
jgi:hypothetical protein